MPGGELADGGLLVWLPIRELGREVFSMER